MKLTYTQQRKLNATLKKMQKKGISLPKIAAPAPKQPLPKGLFLDDDRKPNEVTWINYGEEYDWTVVKTPDEFFKAWTGNEKMYKAVSLDWYLGSLDNTGFVVLEQVCEELPEDTNVDELPFFYFHSSDYEWRFKMQRHWELFVDKRRDFNTTNQKETPMRS